MEFYELLFDYAHCVLNDVELNSNFKTGISKETILEFLHKVEETDECVQFVKASKELVNAIKSI